MRKIRMMILAGICTFALGGCGVSQEVTDRQIALRSQGMEHALAGEYGEAVAAYNEALSLAGMRAGSLELDIASYKASALYREGKLSEAIDTCTAVLDLKKSAQMYLTRGILYREAGDTEAAKADFEAVMERTSAKDQVMLGRVSYYMEDYAKAREYLEAASKEGNTEADYWQAEQYWQMGNVDYAVTLYQNYLQGEVQHQEAYAKVANYQISQGDYDGALKTLESGIAMGDGGSLQTLLAAEIVVYEHKGDFETAKVKMESYLESYPNDEEAAREYEFLRSR